jgi:hypothetical protein
MFIAAKGRRPKAARHGLPRGGEMGRRSSSGNAIHFNLLRYEGRLYGREREIGSWGTTTLFNGTGLHFLVWEDHGKKLTAGFPRAFFLALSSDTRLHVYHRA